MAETLLTELVERAAAVRVIPARSAPVRLGADSLAIETRAADDLKADCIAADRAKEALLCSRIFTLRRLFVEQDGESVVLRGRVESFYHKQLAQELVRAAIDGVEVVNRINVVYGRDKNVTGVDW